MPVLHRDLENEAYLRGQRDVMRQIQTANDMERAVSDAHDIGVRNGMQAGLMQGYQQGVNDGANAAAKQILSRVVGSGGAGLGVMPRQEQGYDAGDIASMIEAAQNGDRDASLMLDHIASTPDGEKAINDVLSMMQNQGESGQVNGEAEAPSPEEQVAILMMKASDGDKNAIRVLDEMNIRAQNGDKDAQAMLSAGSAIVQKHMEEIRKAPAGLFR